MDKRKQTTVEGLLTDRLGRLWGEMRWLASLAAFYVSLISLSLMIVTAYNTTVKEWVAIYLGININFLVFVGAIVFVIMVAILFEKRVTMPRYMAYLNKQVYEQENPMRTDLEVIKRELQVNKHDNEQIKGDMEKVKRALHIDEEASK